MECIWKQNHFYISDYWAENLDNYVKGVMTKNTSAVIIFDGRSGLGKTTLAGQTSCYLHNQITKYMGEDTPDFNLDCLTWTPDAFIEKLQHAKKGDIVPLDEGMILSNRSTLSEMNKMVVQMMSMIRSKQIFVIICINSIFDMDKNLSLHRADCLVHLYAEDDKFATRGRYIVIPSAKGKLKNLYIYGKKLYDYSSARPAFYDHFGKFFPYDEAEYERRKQEAINNYFNNDKKNSFKVRESRDNAIRYLKENYDLGVDELAQAFSLDEKTIYRILKK